MIVLDCGIELPEVQRDRTCKPTKDDYEQCLSRLAECLGNTTGQIIKYIHHCPYTALHFIGELKLAGYIRFEYRYRGNKKDDGTDDALKLTEARVKPTAKLLKVPVEEIHHVPTEPVTTFKGKAHINVRRGVKSNNRFVKQDIKSYEVVKDIRKEKFRINKYILDILAAFPALLSDDDGYIMYQRCINHAHKLKNQEYFMFPQYLCSRGREYDETTVGLSPQGADHEKALVIPCYEEPLTEVGYKALLEAIVGCSEQEWSIEEVISHAKDPINTHYIWKKADKKFS